MKKIILGIELLLLIILMTGCFIYGQGQSIGYIYAIDDGIVWDKAYFKPSMESTETDCYLISHNNNLIKDNLKMLKQNVQIKIIYDKHLGTLSSCNGDTDTNDEIINYEVLK
jgi:hypothetical protein